MEFLSELLTDYDSEFDVTTRRFSSVDGIDGLIEPFVSCGFTQDLIISTDISRIICTKLYIIIAPFTRYHALKSGSTLVWRARPSSSSLCARREEGLARQTRFDS